MTAMTREEIEHLATLARIELRAEEREALAGDLAEIVSYVSAIQEITGSEVATEPTVGPRHNVFRADEIKNAPDSYTETLLEAMPERMGRYMKVQKILSQDE